MKKKTDKDILFERFEKVDPTFKRRIDENDQNLNTDDSTKEESDAKFGFPPEEWVSKYYTMDYTFEGPKFYSNKTGRPIPYPDIVDHWIEYNKQQRGYNPSEKLNENYRNTRYENMTQKQRQRYWDEKISNIMAANTLEDVIQAYSPENPLKITQKEVNKRFGGLGKFKKHLIDDIKQKGTFKGAFATDDDKK
jgi:hypothetical protein